MEDPFGRINEGIQKLPRNNGTLHPVLIIRLAAALALMLVACFVSMPQAVKVILLVLAVIVAAYDIVLELVDAVLNKQFFSAPVLMVLILLLSFLVGRGWEAVLCAILYQLGLILVAFTAKKTKQSAVDMLSPEDRDMRDRIAVILHDDKAGETELGNEMKRAAAPILELLVILAVLFAVIMPIATSLSFKDALRRTMILLALALPGSYLAALPLPGVVGLGFAARFGAVFSSARVLEKLQKIKTVVIDKNGIFADSLPQFIGIKSEILDEKTFMEFVAHAVYYSDQPFAKAILAGQDRDYRLDLISDFRDIPGSGVELKIGGNSVTLARRELLAERGEAVPYEGRQDAGVYYLMIAGKYVGKVLFSDHLNRQNEDLIPELKDAGVERCVLLTEDSRSESEALGTRLDADEVFAEFTDETKLRYLDTLDSVDTMYIYANSPEKHSNAAVDVRASRKGKYADALVDGKDLDHFAAVFSISRRVREITVENAVFAFVVKALLLFLAVTGRCTLWFAIFLEIAAALGTQLNAIRVTKPPLLAKR